MGLNWRDYFVPAVSFTILLLSAPVQALEIALALTRPTGAYQQFQDALKAARTPHQLSDGGSIEGGLDAQVLGRADLIVTVGAQATQEVLARFRRPTMATLISALQVKSLEAAHPDAKFSAIVLDQPAQRHMRLAATLSSGIAKVGMLLGSNTIDMEKGFASAAKTEGLELTVGRVDTSDELLPQLQRLLEASDTLLMVPDPVVASQSSARTILLTSYRYRRPIVAYSHAYVEAGALAAVFSSPEDAARDLADWLRTLSGPAVRLPAVQSPTRFSVSVNRQVARSLGLDVPSNETLVHRVGRGVQP